MKIRYDTGPDRLKMGDFVFRRGELQEVPDTIAQLILRKQSVKFTAVRDSNESNFNKPIAHHSRRYSKKEE